EQHTPFVPHITAFEDADQSPLIYVGPVTFSTLRLALGGEVTDVALGREPGEEAPEGKGLTFTPPAEIRALAGAHRGATAHAVYEGKALGAAGLDWVATHCGELGVRWADAMRGRAQTKGAPSADDVESKAMSPDPRAARLRKYWAHGKGRSKWIKSPHQFRALRRHLAKYVKNPRQLNGLTANIFRLATGIYPGQRPHGGRKSLVDWDAVEIKTAEVDNADEDELGEGAGEWGSSFEDEDLSDFEEDDLLGDDEDEDEPEADETKALDPDRVETSRLALLGQRIVADDEEEEESWADLVAADDVWDLDADGVMSRTSEARRPDGVRK
ncbi:MAG: hypothetical protein ACRDTZ_21470, partial [Pseudonocardiaceae bacterium]